MPGLKVGVRVNSGVHEFVLSVGVHVLFPSSPPWAYRPQGAQAQCIIYLNIFKICLDNGDHFKILLLIKAI